MSYSVAEQLKNTIRDVADFPKAGILFKDITPVLADPRLSLQVSQALFDHWEGKNIQAVIGIESRGFIYGLQLAQQLEVPFVPIRKVGKLPYKKVRHSYNLEYGSAEIEIHEDAIKSGDNVLIHDDLLATGGTGEAASHLVAKLNGRVMGYSFLVELTFLNGREKLVTEGAELQSLVNF
jgi:adenine phosphoribosyltransferase